MKGDDVKRALWCRWLWLLLIVAGCGGGSEGDGDSRPPEVTARLTATPVSGEAPLTVVFDARATVDGDVLELPDSAFSWDLGDGSSRQGVTITHTYSQVGTFDVVLTVTTDIGSTTIRATSTTTITVLEAVQPEPENPQPENPEPEQPEPEQPEPEQPENPEPEQPDNPEPEQPEPEQPENPEPEQPEPEQPEPENPQPEQPDPTPTPPDPTPPDPTPPDPTPLPNQAPVAAFDVIPPSGVAPLTVLLDASASGDVDGLISVYSWNLGDGNTTTGVNVEHSYADAGEYTVTLTVTDDRGATAQASQTITVVAETVGNQAPVAAFTAEPTQGDAPLTVVLDGGGSSDPDGTITAYAWTFGDGESAVGEQVEHTYEDGGNYTVTLTVVDDGGAIATATADITVTAVNQAPVAAFTLSPAEGNAPLTVAFDGGGSSDDGIISTYNWDFGDGNTATGAQVNHEFTSVGEYTVTLTVTDDVGVSTSVQQTVTVREAQVANRAPTVMVAATPQQGDAPLEVAFVATASDPDGDALSYTWDFGDGGRSEGETRVSYNYASPGTFTATVTVIDGRGGRAEASVDVMVNQVATNLQYAGTWRWVAQSFDGGSSYVGYVTINATDDDNPSARNIELGSWYYCGATFDTCSSTPTGTGIIADFATGFGDYRLGVSFIIGNSDVRLSILDEDGLIGNEFGEPSIQGSGIWQDPNGAQTFVGFGMSRLPAGETFP